MRYQVDIDQTSLVWKVGDKPDVRGTITADGDVPTILGVTIRLYSPTGEFVSERIATSYDSVTGEFICVLPDFLTARKDGLVYVSVLEDSTYTRTLSSAINTTDSTVALTGSTGTLQDLGYCLIGSEWIQYSLSGSNMTMVKRGAFNTTIASHLISSAVYFMSVKETCTPDYPFVVRDIMELWANVPSIC